MGDIIKEIERIVAKIPDKRMGPNLKYELREAMLSGFSVFFTQCASFLAWQKKMEEDRGTSNARSLFGIENIPSDNQIRNILDSIEPKILKEAFDKNLKILERTGHLDKFRVLLPWGSQEKLEGAKLKQAKLPSAMREKLVGQYLVGLDGTEYFYSNTIHCENCTIKHHKDGSISYHHQMIGPVIVSPGNNRVIGLFPEFIMPQDGEEKQDCEFKAAKRWLRREGKKLKGMGGGTILVDDLHCKQPLCEEVLSQGLHFIAVCKESSHPTLYEYLKIRETTKDIHMLEKQIWNGKYREIWTYRWANELPIRDGKDALEVNWCELTVKKENRKVLKKFRFATDHQITEDNIELLIASGRARWKAENESHNTLKNQGYHLEHNFGHGNQYLSMLLATMNLLAFEVHTMMEFMDKKYQFLREKLPNREVLFDDLRAMLRYMYFESWESLLSFMVGGLKKRYKLTELPVGVGRDPPEKVA